VGSLLLIWQQQLAAAGFDPASGFPWNDTGDELPAPLVFDETAQAWAIGPPAFDPAAGFPWQTADADASAPLAFDDTDQAWVPAEPIWAPLVGSNEPGPEVSAPLVFDDTAQSWAITTAPNWDPATGWPWQGQTPDVPAQGVVDDTPQSYPIQPVAAAGFDPASGFPWTTEGHLPDQTVVDYDGQDGALGLTPWDPTLGYPWSQLDPQQDRSTQPVWYDGQDGSTGLTPPAAPAFDPATGFPWNGDAAQDVSTQPVWYDGIDGSFIGQPYNPAQFPFTGWDPQQDRSLQPVWYDPSEQAWAIQTPFDPASALSFISADHLIPAFVPPFVPEQPTFPPFAALSVVPVVTGGRGPDSGGAYSAIPAGSATAPLPGGSASDPVPQGTATSPTPGR
jgi:hypothetical protein